MRIRMKMTQLAAWLTRLASGLQPFSALSWSRALSLHTLNSNKVKKSFASADIVPIQLSRIPKLSTMVKLSTVTKPSKVAKLLTMPRETESTMLERNRVD
jgi:hypothetical protein